MRATVYSWRFLSIVAVVCVCGSGFAVAQGMGGLRLDGSNMIRNEHYESWGAESTSPWSQTGSHWFNELTLQGVRAPGPYETLHLQFSGLYNQSAYRSSFREFLVENWSVQFEKGDWRVPLRLHAGDFLADVSRRTQFGSLKGAQIELQPSNSLSGERHSLLGYWGVDHASWNKLRQDAEFAAGVSWLVEDASFGTLSLNHVGRTFKPDASTGLDRQDQIVSSVAYERYFSLGKERFTLEAEAAHFHGAPKSVVSSASGDVERGDKGLFAALTWESDSPFSGNVQMEWYGRDFEPAGGSVPTNRRSLESRFGWTLPDGRPLGLRYQFYEDGFQDDNSTTTNVWGADLGGPFVFGNGHKVQGVLSGYVSTTVNDDHTTDSITSNVDASFTLPVHNGWTFTPRFGWTTTDDRTPAGGIRQTAEINVGGTHAVAWRGWKGSGSLGLSTRRNDGGGDDGFDFAPTASLFVDNGPHAVNFDAGWQALQRELPGAGDSDTYSLGSQYTYTRGPHELGAELRFENRQNDPGDDGSSLLAACYWRIDFGRAADLGRPRDALPATSKVRADLSLLTALWPGMSLDEAEQTLAEAGVTDGARHPGVRVYEVRLLRDVAQRQRLALELDGQDKVASIALVINPTDVGQPDTVKRLYQRIYSRAAREFGQPDRFAEEGEFGPALYADVNAGRIVRTVEWNTGSGTLRFGIPRRLDGQVRIEFQHARSFPGMRNAMWSINEVK